METWLNPKMVFEGKIFSVKVGEVRLDDGSLARREIVLHRGGVGIVPILNDEVLLVRQFRIAIGRPILEIPAGRLEEGEEPEHRAKVELEEEIGYRPGRLVYVASCYCSPGFTNEKDHIFLAFDLEKTRPRREFDEHLELVRIPIAQIETLLANCELEDSKTIIGLRALLAYLDK